MEEVKKKMLGYYWCFDSVAGYKSEKKRSIFSLRLFFLTEGV
jgi:hypothetical protein